MTQTVLAKLAVQLRRFAYDPAQSFRGWLRTVVRNAYRLTAIEGLSGAAAAARLGMKVAAVFVSKSHVMRHLRDEVQALEREHEASPPRG